MLVCMSVRVCVKGRECVFGCLHFCTGLPVILNTYIPFLSVDQFVNLVYVIMCREQSACYGLTPIFTQGQPL